MILSDKYKTIIFDMDGVITSEEQYWNAAVYTLANCDNTEVTDIKKTRSKYLYGDKLIRLFKERGINSNWDLAYLVRAFTPGGGDGKDVYDMLYGTDMLAFELYDKAAQLLSEKLSLPVEKTVREGMVWREMQEDFQAWFLGSDLYEEYNGVKYDAPKRSGLCNGEQPLTQNAIQTLYDLSKKGVRLCIATGRPLKEALSPLKLWGILDLFDKNSIASYNHIRNAEEKLKMQGKLTKPHPYVFLKAFLGTDFNDEDIVSGNFKADLSQCLAVGDAGADMLSAQNAGMDFAAVLTGIAGKDAKDEFVKNGATYILDSVEEIK